MLIFWERMSKLSFLMKSSLYLPPLGTYFLAEGYFLVEGCLEAEPTVFLGMLRLVTCPCFIYYKQKQDAI